MKNSVSFVLTALVLTMVFAISCSRTVVKPESDIDTPRDHYLSGMQKLDAESLEDAEKDFNRAVELDPSSPFGYTGLAYLEVLRGNYRQALKHVKKAVKNDKSFADAHAAGGYAVTARKRGKNWFADAEKYFGRALEIDPGNERALFYRAGCLLKAQYYDDAAKTFKLVVDKNGMYARRARGRLSLANRILKVTPIVRSCAYIVLDESIDRADLGVLLEDLMRIRIHVRHYRPRLFSEFYTDDLTLVDRSVRMPPDINNHVGKKQIHVILPLAVEGVSVFPNGYYYPDKIVTREQFAVTVQSILALLRNDPDLATRYYGSASVFPDVRTDFYAYNAISLCVNEGLMDVDPHTGDFRPHATVSGIDAVEMLRRLEKAITADNAGSNE